jgi:ion channel POLLUX/CASTOR
MSQPKKPVSLDTRVHYLFDKAMAAGPIAQIGLLAIFTIAILLSAAAAMLVFGIRPEGTEALPVAEALWMTLMHTLDAGTLAGDAGWPFRIIMGLVTLGGIFIVSILIGVLSSGIENKLEELRRGRSTVVEDGHTLILGWSTNIFAVISELVVANKNVLKPRIVILANKDKVEMEEEIRANVGHTGRTQIVCRTGNPIKLPDLAIVDPHSAKSIVILSPEEENPDAQVIKSILALTNNPNRRPEPYHIVAEIRDPKNMEAARLVGHGEAQLVLSSDVISRITVQTCLQSGMSVVYTELLDFAGVEVYLTEEPRLVGKSFGEALLAYEDAAVMGVRSTDGQVLLNPPMDRLIAAGDKVIAIAEDDDRVRLAPAPAAVNEAAIRRAPVVEPVPERTLILGWNRRALTVIEELDQYVAPGSELTVVAFSEGLEETIEELRASRRHLNITHQFGDTTSRRVLDGLDVVAYQHVIVLSYSDELDTQEADARTLVTLLHLRQIVELSGTPVSIVSEMLDIHNRELAEVTKVDDFIVSDKLISLMLAQISENQDLNAVFKELLDPEGAEIYLKPAAHYVTLDEPVSFQTVVESARRQGQVAIGYRLARHASDVSRAYGVTLNPRKAATVGFTEQDRIIVVADA